MSHSHYLLVLLHKSSPVQWTTLEGWLHLAVLQPTLHKLSVSLHSTSHCPRSDSNLNMTILNGCYNILYCCIFWGGGWATKTEWGSWWKPVELPVVDFKDAGYVAFLNEQKKQSFMQHTVNTACQPQAIRVDRNWFDLCDFGLVPHIESYNQIPYGISQKAIEWTLLTFKKSILDSNTIKIKDGEHTKLSM